MKHETGDYLKQARDYVERKMWAQALVCFSKAIESGNNSDAVYKERGNIYSELNQHAEALADYTMAISINPGNDMAFNNRGIIFENLKQHDKAMKDYNRAIKINPANDKAYFNRGKAYVDAKKYDLAMADANRAIELNQTNSQAYLMRGFLYGVLSNATVQAIADFDKAIELEPNNGQYYLVRGDAYSSVNEHEKSIADIKRATALNPNATYPLLGISPDSSNQTAEDVVKAPMLDFKSRLATFKERHGEKVKLPPEEVALAEALAMLAPALEKQLGRPLTDVDIMVNICKLELEEIEGRELTDKEVSELYEYCENLDAEYKAKGTVRLL